MWRASSLCQRFPEAVFNLVLRDLFYEENCSAGYFAAKSSGATFVSSHSSHSEDEDPSEDEHSRFLFLNYRPKAGPKLLE